MARKKAVTQASTETLEPRVYELGFLLSPAVREEDLDSSCRRDQGNYYRRGRINHY
jgi:hypothetical protein